MEQGGEGPTSDTASDTSPITTMHRHRNTSVTSDTRLRKWLNLYSKVYNSVEQHTTRKPGMPQLSGPGVCLYVLLMVKENKKVRKADEV